MSQAVTRHPVGKSILRMAVILQGEPEQDCYFFECNPVRTELQGMFDFVQSMCTTDKWTFVPRRRQPSPTPICNIFNQ